jgi:two-component system nitrate/nitrite response regulator NarL
MCGLSDLTPREMEILQLIIEGHSNRCIALQVGICEKTVEFHLDRIYTKIGVHTRLRAAMWAIQQGMEIATREIPS